MKYSGRPGVKKRFARAKKEKPARTGPVYPGRHRCRGPIDVIYETLGIKKAQDLADRIQVTRQTIYRWQHGSPIGPEYRMRLDLLLIAHGKRPIFGSP